MRYRRIWLQREGVEREALVHPLTLDCPFCGGALGSLAGGGDFRYGQSCDCGAAVTRVQDGIAWSSPPGTVAQAYRDLREVMRATVVGHDHVVARLALIGARHLHLGGLQRALIIGPSGAGKTTLGSAFAGALGCPMAVWDVGASSEAGWAGIDSSRVFAELYEICDRDLTRMSRAVLVLDEIDKIAVRDATGVTRQHRIGQQKSLLTIVGGGLPVRFPAEGDKGRSVAASTDQMLILGMGAFEGLPRDPGPSELVRYGFMVELASRFPIILPLGRPGRDVLLTLLERAAVEATAAADEFGFDIRASEGFLRYIAAAVEAASGSITPRAGIGWMQAAVDTMLLRLLDDGAPPGTQAILQPDDVTIPGLSRGHTSRPR